LRFWEVLEWNAQDILDLWEYDGKSPIGTARDDLLNGWLVYHVLVAAGCKKVEFDTCVMDFDPPPAKVVGHDELAKALKLAGWTVTTTEVDADVNR
jgi:hypothetical protein